MTGLSDDEKDKRELILALVYIVGSVAWVATVLAICFVMAAPEGISP